ncbi:hypothetical protein B0H14DRAFT_2645515 [Mycena olivaceomarginata]|nr:hypothetical protein B0H14DRAFT_2645515 [Mycena olivaceomarginata]
MSPTWRGNDPDRRYTADMPPLPDKAWDDPIPIPSTVKIYPSQVPPTAPVLLANPPLTPVKKSRSKAAQAKEKDLRKPCQSVVGISSHLKSLGVKSPDKKPEDKKPEKPEECTDADVDHSLYLWPRYLFPSLDNQDDISTLGIELVGFEHDPRSIVLDLKKCYLEIESLLHTSPQIFRNDEWMEVTRVPAKHRGFKVVIALQLRRIWKRQELVASQTCFLIFGAGPNMWFVGSKSRMIILDGTCIHLRRFYQSLAIILCEGLEDTLRTKLRIVPVFLCGHCGKTSE